jgi:Flp pilus assembly protein TadG
MSNTKVRDLLAYLCVSEGIYPMKRMHVGNGEAMTPKTAIQPWRGLRRRDVGSSLIETAIIAPILVLLVCYAINFGYYFSVALNLTAAARSAVEYSIQGFASPSGEPTSSGTTAPPLPLPASVCALAIGGLGNLAKSSTTTSVKVCSASANRSGTDTVACVRYGASALSYALDNDPSPNFFQCNRVDVMYTIDPPVPLTFFNLRWTPPATFHRSVEMRAIN